MMRSKTSQILSLPLALGLAVSAWGAPRIEKHESDLLEELDNLLRPAPQVEQQPKPKPGSSRWQADEKMLNELIEDSLQGRPAAPDLGEDLGKPSGASLEGIEQSMDQATELLGKRSRASDTARMQQKIITDLDELIKQAEKQCSNCSNPNNQSSSRQQSQRSQPKPSRGKPSQGNPQASQAASSSQQSTSRVDKAATQDSQGPASAELMKEVWGHLPQRVREQMLQSSSDEFLPQYKEEIEKYFRRLAEEEASSGRGQ